MHFVGIAVNNLIPLRTFENFERTMLLNAFVIWG